jgi:hypothetical protein
MINTWSWSIYMTPEDLGLELVWRRMMAMMARCEDPAAIMIKRARV